MKLVPMRFNGFSWHHNPHEITFECDRKVNEHNSPFGKAYIQDTGRKNIIVKGVGELYGTDCMEQFDRLLQLFKRGGQGVLAIPKLTPIYALFESVKILGEPKPDVLTYSFVFREVMERKTDLKPMSYIAQKDETLWDISHKFDIPIDELVALNIHIKRPDIVLDGSVIKLC